MHNPDSLILSLNMEAGSQLNVIKHTMGLNKLTNLTSTLVN